MSDDYELSVKPRGNEVRVLITKMIAGGEYDGTVGGCELLLTKAQARAFIYQLALAAGGDENIVQGLLGSTAR